jgi:hypothetical protein
MREIYRKGFVKLDISILKTANSKTTIRFAVLDSE